jgi:gluconate 5-dehydrogenase
MEHPLAQNIFTLTGRIALITGSSRGIGLAFAEALAGAGAEVVLNGRHEDALESARAALAATGAKVHARGFNVSDRTVVHTAVEDIEATIGPIDILFNNAGMQRRAPLAEYDPDTWRALMATNLDSVFFVSQAVGPRMVARKRGKIVNTCSLNSEVARPTIAPYATSKGAVKMLTKAMCAEWAPHGIQVNGIGPGFFRTELNRALYEDPAFDGWVKQRAPAGRWGELNELKGVAVFLASDASNYVNGQIIYVDGGMLSVI